MNLVAFIQARETSTRFPGKVRERLGDKSLVQRVLSVANQIRGVIFADVLWPEKGLIREEDVLSRFYLGYHRLGMNYDGIVRLTGDCPFLDVNVCNLVVSEFEKGCDYASNVWPKRTFPDGLDCEIFTPSTLEDAHAMADSPRDREHVTTWMQRNTIYRSVELPIDWSWVRLTVDTPEDLVWLRQCLAAPRS